DSTSPFLPYTTLFRSATVMIKNSTQGTQTDIDGNFMLEIPSPEAIIVITYQGYFPIEVPAGNDRERRFVMEFDEEQNKLEEVVRSEEHTSELQSRENL